jgi:hypothetical protein
MYIAYSATNCTAYNAQQKRSRLAKFIPRKQKQRIEGYQAACRKYQKEIEAIQEYLPGWQPKLHF